MRLVCPQLRHFLSDFHGEEKQLKHSKNIQYDKLQRRAYMQSPIFSNEEVNLMHAVRSRSTGCKANVKQKYIHTNTLCMLCGDESEDEQHLLKCKVIQTNLKLTKYPKVL